MSSSEHVRRAAVLATIAVAFGATAAAAASPPPPDDAPPATSETPAPPIETAPTVATDDVDATSDPATTLDLTPSTTPVTTSAPGEPPTSTVPAAAIATTTQPPANEADAAALATVVASAPASPVAKPGNGTVTLTWQTPASSGGATIDKYTVQRSGNGTSGWVTVGTPTGTSYTAGGLTNGTRYYFRVVAHNAGGNGKSSPVVDAVPRTVPGTPPDCSATQAYGPGTTIMWVAWSRPANDGGAPIDYFIVEAWDVNGFAAGAFVSLRYGPWT